MPKKTVCLNMIVKNEAHVIKRCLDSVRPLIDHWVIVDTGSTDGTQRLIREYMKDIPGQLIERPWVDFAHNRSEAIQSAAGKADYLLFMDADDFLEHSKGPSLPDLSADAYQLEIRHNNITYKRTALVRETLQWRYLGVLHEYLVCNLPTFNSAILPDVFIRYGADGARSQIPAEEKYRRDAEILEKALVKDPGNARYMFYLGQSYRDAKMYEQALAAYDKRLSMVGFDEEVFCSLLQGARIAHQLGRQPSEIVDRYLKAHEVRPSRAEALGSLSKYLRENKDRWTMAYLFAERAIQIPMTSDILFVEQEWYLWRCLDEYAVAAYWVGEYQKSLTACEKLLAGKELPNEHRARITANANFARSEIKAAPGTTKVTVRYW